MILASVVTAKGHMPKLGLTWTVLPAWQAKRCKDHFAPLHHFSPTHPMALYLIAGAKLKWSLPLNIGNKWYFFPQKRLFIGPLLLFTFFYRAYIYRAYVFNYTKNASFKCIYTSFHLLLCYFEFLCDWSTFTICPYVQNWWYGDIMVLNNLGGLSGGEVMDMIFEKEPTKGVLGGLKWFNWYCI